MKPKDPIMYIEFNGQGLIGPARIGRVHFSKSGKSIHYDGKTFEALNGTGYKANYFDVETGEHYWISGCREDGMDALYNTNVSIDEDVKDEYWCQIRNQPENKEIAQFMEKRNIKWAQHITDQGKQIIGSSSKALLFFFSIEITWFFIWYIIYLNTPYGGNPPGKGVVAIINGIGLFIFSITGIVYGIKKLPKDMQRQILLISQIILLIVIFFSAG